MMMMMMMMMMMSIKIIMVLTQEGCIRNKMLACAWSACARYHPHCTC
jgi:hypothetical protein